MATEAGVPAPTLVGHANAPVARYFGRKVGADDTERVRALVADLPEMLGHVDGLIADGMIGGEQPNAADFQIGSTVRALLTFEDLAPAIRGRPAADLAMRLMPEFPTSVPAGFIPAEWLPPLHGCAEGARPPPPTASRRPSRLWVTKSARAICRAMLSASVIGMAPRESRSASVGPSTSSRTSAGAEPASSMP